MLTQKEAMPFDPPKMESAPWEKVLLVRNSSRPSAMHLIRYLFDDFMELHGDRLYGDDKALVGGIAKFNGIPVTVIAQERDQSLKDRLMRNFAMMHPEGYRKAKRLAAQAERFKRPVICIVDTPGAYPGIGAEERGQAEAIAQCLLMFSALKTPVISIVIGQGNSGGALALATADKVFMFENAIFAVISPEGFASICWHDPSRAQEASEVMKMTAEDMAELGIVDEIIPEAKGGLHCDPEYSYRILRDSLTSALDDLLKEKLEDLTAERLNRLRYSI
jgi:acetyl-CoA carboxylase carboxyl transferase subunit alpha